ncbi:MAG: glycosyltransferase, partial [Thomasclavelia spiroformis]
IITKEMIENQSNNFLPLEYDNNCIKLLSIGRFSNAKNFDNIPAICKYIVDKGVDIKWYIIGYGGNEQLIKDKIQEYNMSNHVFILGKKENPYPYIKACDIYVQPSRYEGKAVTVREAQILCKPVVITSYPTSKSQVVDGVDGIIVPMDNEGCAQGIVDFIKNTKLKNELVQYLKEHDYSNSNEVEKIYELMED